MDRISRKQGEPARSDTLVRKMVFVVVGLAVVFVVVQFFKLATLGRIGKEISDIKNQQSEAILKNELLQSEISELKSPTNLESSLSKFGAFVPAKTTNIELNTSLPEESVASSK